MSAPVPSKNLAFRNDTLLLGRVQADGVKETHLDPGSSGVTVSNCRFVVAPVLVGKATGLGIVSATVLAEVLAAQFGVFLCPFCA